MKGREVCNKTRSPSASLLFKGQGTEHITVKWPILLTPQIGERMPKITQSKHHKRANRIFNGNPGNMVLVNGILTNQIFELRKYKTIENDDD